jgi:hypothetical protein
VTRAITILLDEHDYDCLSRQAKGLGIPPSVAARELIHANLLRARPRVAADVETGPRSGGSFGISTPGSALSRSLVSRVERVRAPSVRERPVRATGRGRTRAAGGRPVSR